MEVDAFLTVETTLIFTGKELILSSIKMAIIGPNQIPYNEKDKKKYAPMGPLKGYLEGIRYGFAEVRLKKGIVIATLKNGQVQGVHIDKLDTVYGRITERLVTLTNEELNKLAAK